MQSPGETSLWRFIPCYKPVIPLLTNFSRPPVYLDQDSDDSALVRRSLEGDAGAFEQLVSNYQRVLFSVALRLMGNYEDARDATQNAFIKVYQRLDTYDSRYRFFSWIYRHFASSTNASTPDAAEIQNTRFRMTIADLMILAHRSKPGSEHALFARRSWHCLSNTERSSS